MTQTMATTPATRSAATAWDAESCDGTNLNGADCPSQGFSGGTLACVNCAFDTSACTSDPTCGDGVVEGAESCDGTDLNGADCLSRGFTGGSLACVNCAFDTSACTSDPTCGNDLMESTELCDGTDLGEIDCVSLDMGFRAGTLVCAATCDDYDTSGCTTDPTGLLTNLPDGCPVYTYTGPVAGEEDHFIAGRLTPPSAPYQVTEIGFGLQHDTFGGLCDSTIDVEVIVFVSSSATPPATPTVLETITVPGALPPSWTANRFIHLTLSTPVTLQAGEELFIAMRNGGAYPSAVTCPLMCNDADNFVEDRNWWSNAGTPPYPWATLGSFNIDGTFDVWAIGSPQ